MKRYIFEGKVYRSDDENNEDHLKLLKYMTKKRLLRVGWYGFPGKRVKKWALR